jgi:hypothetical protein
MEPAQRAPASNNSSQCSIAAATPVKWNTYGEQTVLHALVAGIKRYSDPQISGLSYATADAEAIANMIRSGIREDERHVVLLTDENATKRNIMVAIGEDLARVTTPSDTIILYFAGHGSPETAGSSDETVAIPHSSRLGI